MPGAADVLKFGTDGPLDPHPGLSPMERGVVVRVWRSLSSREIFVTSSSDSRNFESASDLSQRLGLPFSNLALLTRALTHRSYVNENPELAGG